MYEIGGILFVITILDVHRRKKHFYTEYCYGQGSENVNRLRFLTISTISVLLSWQCIDPPAEPIIPTWDVDVSLPLINRQYMLEELVEKNPELLSIDENGMLIYSFSDTMQNDPFGDLIRLHPEPADFSFGIGVFTLSPPEVDFTVEVGPYPGLQPGYEGTSPGVPPVPVSGTLPPVDSMTYMIVESGFAGLGLFNESGVPVELPGGVTITNSDDGTVVGHFIFNDVIDPGEYVESFVNFEDTRVNRDLEYDFTFSSPPDDDVTIPDEPVLAFNLHFDELYVSEAEAQIPGQTLQTSYEGEVVIDDSTYVTEVLFSQGILELQMRNLGNINVPVTVTFPELRPRNNPSQEYSISRTLPRGSINTYTIDIQHMMIHNTTLKNSLTYIIRLGTIEGTNDYRVVRSTDAISGEVKASEPPYDELVVERIEGIIPPTRYDISEHVTLDIGDPADMFEGDVRFNDVQLNLGLFLDGGFDAIANLSIVGENKDGVRDSLEIPVGQRHFSVGEWTSIVFDKSNSPIDDFLSTFVPHFPEDLYVTGNLMVNPDYEDGYIDVNNTLTTSVQLNVPFDFGIQGGLVRDTLSIGDGDDGLDGDMFDYFNYGHMYFETDNGIPLEMDMRINLLDDQDVVMRQFPITGEPAIGIKAAPVDSSGRVTGTAGRDVRVLNLSREDIRLVRDADKTELLLFINTNDDNETVVFNSQNSIRLKIYATFNITADFN